MREWMRWSIVGLYVGSTLFLISLYTNHSPLTAVKSALKSRQPERVYSYTGKDYPQAWQLDLDTVHMSLEDSVHYSIDTPAGDAEWAALLPTGGAVIHLGPDQRPFTVSMFHELRCLDIVRRNIVDFYADESPEAKIAQPKLTRHCMNYIRQMILCRADMRLESVRAPYGHRMTVSEVTHTCRDWTQVVEAAEENHEAFAARNGSWLAATR
ncbi:hypothetical protein OF83DRAFT_1171268 [Amylostereum chailletii]|nr:hypothetical protein OF83DRAFT_1171268 [Amylostereum chailletii]